MLDTYFPLYITIFLICAVTTLAIERRLIPFLSKKAQQPIYEGGPKWHVKKSGTPTMGGLAFIAALLFAFLLYCIYTVRRGAQATLAAPALVLIYATLSGAIGFFDDYRKLIKRENKGLGAAQKYALQLLVTA